ncbi:MAG: hypothetical protein KDD94_02345 [Calditrichaeota bacterium]|nr:hypothetical protein [Calditrichota bacterium]
MFKYVCTLALLISLSSQTFRLSAGYGIGAHLGGAEDSEGAAIADFENSISLPMKNLLAGGNGISFDASFNFGDKEGSQRTIVGLRFKKNKYKGEKTEDDQAFITGLFTGLNTAYIDEELEVTTIIPYIGFQAGEGLFKGYVTIGLAITDYKWQYDADPALEFTTGIGGHLGIGVDMQNLGGTGIGFNAEIGFQLVWSGNEQIDEAIKNSNSDFAFYWTNHMFTAQAGVIYTLDLY